MEHSYIGRSRVISNETPLSPPFPFADTIDLLPHMFSMLSAPSFYVPAARMAA